MSKAKSEAGQVEAGAGTGEDSGRFAIDAERRAATVVPPTTPEAEELSLDVLDAMIDAAPTASKPATVPPPVPAAARSRSSGLAPARSRAPVAVAPVAEDDGPMDSLRPFYKELGAPRERAEVDIADLSLQPDNPYLASSLVPPAEQSTSTGRILVGAAAVLAILAGGYFAFARATAAPARTIVVAPRSAPVIDRAASSVEPGPAAAVKVVEPAPAPVAQAVEPAPATKPAAVGAPQHVEVAPPVEASPVAARTAAPVEPAPAGVDARATAPVVVAAAEAASTDAPTPVAATPTASAAAATAPITPAAAATSAPSAVEAAAAPTNLPETPTREQVAAGFDALRPDLLQCAAGKAGVVVIDATLAGAGRVAYALVDGTAFKGTPEGSCMARAIRKARFPQFSQATLKVRYPVQL